MLEKVIEEAVCTYARKTYKAITPKFTSPGRRNVPDRIFIFYGCIIFIEFKATGKEASPAQEREHARLRERGHTVYVVDDIAAGKTIVDRHGRLF